MTNITNKSLHPNVQMLYCIYVIIGGLSDGGGSQDSMTLNKLTGPADKSRKLQKK